MTYCDFCQRYVPEIYDHYEKFHSEFNKENAELQSFSSKAVRIIWGTFLLIGITIVGQIILTWI